MHIFIHSCRVWKSVVIGVQVCKNSDKWSASSSTNFTSSSFWEPLDNTHLVYTFHLCYFISPPQNIVTTDLESGDRGKAMKRLRVPPLGETQNPWTTFRFGLFLGLSMCIVLLIIAVTLGVCTLWTLSVLYTLHTKSIHQH